MRKLVLLSDLRNMNPALIRKIKNITGGQSLRLAYIPSRTDKERWYFDKAKPEFSEMDITDFFYFDVDEDFESSQLVEFTSCDAIFLSGGNTYQFLKNLKDRNIFKHIKQMVNEGKPLIGVSAGSMIMSKSIKIAAFHDENEVQLNELSGLELVDFEFMPHWNREKDQLEELLKYSLTQEESIFTCNDGDGIVIEGDEIEFYGDIKEIRKGVLI
ncbi:Type 1 glutamine amidotransferase-like domain-containing protein [Mesobacillus jeotgali]|uniref:Type 1 glutamine amidotransferase-like domain-containing protein n=1 Tax=Mesobacillus jeotgali TaxID=129985 RepID=UPI001781E849|nr:Type 1 glutamine amidotransferase-like domain-containing protein [Mesobacillus jeotgali]UYZ23785.1 Type 1 glutamine amidotransferase-like domain-containing protein [Mesobacillus jeotgali]